MAGRPRRTAFPAIPIALFPSHPPSRHAGFFKRGVGRTFGTSASPAPRWIFLRGANIAASPNSSTAEARLAQARVHYASITLAPSGRPRNVSKKSQIAVSGKFPIGVLLLKCNLIKAFALHFDKVPSLFVFSHNSLTTYIKARVIR